MLTERPWQSQWHKHWVKKRGIADGQARFHPKWAFEDMAEVTGLHELKGDFIHLEYKLPSGKTVRLWDGNKIYYDAEICKRGSTRCYGPTADDAHLLVCEYGDSGDCDYIRDYKLSMAVCFIHCRR